MSLRISLVLTVLLVSCGILHAEETEVQRRACRPDVFRLCAKWIPSREAITACLIRQMQQLNPDCRAVMEGRLR